MILKYVDEEYVRISYVSFTSGFIPNDNSRQSPRPLFPLIVPALPAADLSILLCSLSDIPFSMRPTYLCTYKWAIKSYCWLILFLSPTYPPQSNFKPSNHIFFLFPFPCPTNAPLTPLSVANIGNSSIILQFSVCLFMCVFSHLIPLILCKN